MEGNTHKVKFCKKRFFLKLSKKLTQNSCFSRILNKNSELMASGKSLGTPIENMNPFFYQLTGQDEVLKSSPTEFFKFKTEDCLSCCKGTDRRIGSSACFVGEEIGENLPIIENLGNDASIKLPQKRTDRKISKPTQKVMNRLINLQPDTILSGTSRPTYDPLQEIEFSKASIKKSDSFIEKVKLQAKAQKLDYTFIKGFLSSEPEDQTFTVQEPRHLEGFTIKKKANTKREALISSLRTQISERKAIHLEYEEILSKPTTDLLGPKKLKISENSYKTVTSTQYNPPIFSDLLKSELTLESVSTIDSSPCCIKDFEILEKMTNQSQSAFDDKSEICEFEKNDLANTVKKLDFNEHENFGMNLVDEEEMWKISLMKERRGIEKVRKIQGDVWIVDKKDDEYLKLIEKPRFCVRSKSFLGEKSE